MQIIGKHPFLLFCCHFLQNSKWTKTSYQESASLSAHFSKSPSVSVRAGKRWEITLIAGFNARADRRIHVCYTRTYTHTLLHCFPSRSLCRVGLFLPRVFWDLRGNGLGDIRRNTAETKPSPPQSCLSSGSCWSSSFGLSNKCDLNPGPSLGTSFPTSGMGSSPIRRCSTKH